MWASGLDARSLAGCSRRASLEPQASSFRPFQTRQRAPVRCNTRVYSSVSSRDLLRSIGPRKRRGPYIPNWPPPEEEEEEEEDERDLEADTGPLETFPKVDRMLGLAMMPTDWLSTVWRASFSPACSFWDPYRHEAASPHKRTKPGAFTHTLYCRGKNTSRRCAGPLLWEASACRLGSTATCGCAPPQPAKAATLSEYPKVGCCKLVRWCTAHVL